MRSPSNILTFLTKRVGGVFPKTLEMSRKATTTNEENHDQSRKNYERSTNNYW